MDGLYGRLEQPCGGQVELHTGPFAGQPRAGLQPADQVLLTAGSAVAVAVGVLDLPGVQPVRTLSGGVLLEYSGVGDAELRGQMGGDRPGDVGRVGQERAEETDGADLDGEPEAVVLSAADVDELACRGVTVEVAVELRLLGVVDVAAVAAPLLDGEENPRPPARRVSAPFPSWSARPFSSRPGAQVLVDGLAADPILPGQRRLR